MKRNIFRIEALKFLRDRFSLKDDMGLYDDIIQRIKKDVDIRGTNLWVLIFAIFVASIGLNVNSTAVIIGAMLISPLMGPIMGIGMGIAINDFELIKKGIKNLSIAALMSVVTSTLYFMISPLHQAQSELLARTTPTIWDVFIAMFGGLAGIVAATRKEKSNVVPGVAIATALMPPLCTAGYGLATGQWMYFLGALYLFFINSVFISISTLLIVRFLKFPSVSFVDEKHERKVRMSVALVVFITVVPSIYLGYRIVKRSIFDSNVAAFVENEFQFDNTQVLKYTVNDDNHKVEVILVGKQLSDDAKDQVNARFKKQFQQKDAELVIREGLSGNQNIDMNSIRTGVIEDLYGKQEDELKTKDEKITFLENELYKIKESELAVEDMARDLQSFYPNMQDFSVSYMPVLDVGSMKKDTVLTALISYKGTLQRQDRDKIIHWLMSTTHADTARLIVE